MGLCEGRRKKLRAYVDRLACILPFEEAYFRGHGVNATFVGHPLFDQLPSIVPPRNADRIRRTGRWLVYYRVRENPRRRIIFPIFWTWRDESPRRSPRHASVPTTLATDPVVRRELAARPGSRPPIEIELDGFNRLVPCCDLCITVSGTATVHVASLGVPMIVVYRANPVLWHVAGRWLVKTRTLRRERTGRRTPAHAYVGICPSYRARVHPLVRLQ